MPTSDVTVVTGCGGMGSAVVRRIGSGQTVVLADVSETALHQAVADLRDDGYSVLGCVVDVSNQDSIDSMVSLAAEQGQITSVVHTAGVSPAQSIAERILSVDLLGTARVLDAFQPVLSEGGVGVFIASMAGTMAALDSDLERRLAANPTEELLSIPELAAISDAGTAYGVAKRANQLRVRAAAVPWGQRGCRVNSISPGIISTKMGAAELESPIGEIMRDMIIRSGTGRIGTPSDIAAAVEFLLSPQASFITGTDLLVDGGVCAALLGGRSDT